MVRFVSLSISPWSEKARWALLHHGIRFHEEHYIPGLGEPLLRLRLRKLVGRVTVPVLHDGSRWYTDSYDIARWAERVGGGAPLFPRDKVDEIDEWNRRSEEVMAAGRALLVLTMLGEPGAARGMVPKVVPRALRPVAVALARVGNQMFARKYQMDGELAGYRDRSLAGLDELQRRLSGRDYLLSDFSYADITMAVALHMLSPVPRRYMAALPGAGRLRNEELLARYAPLISWRDQLYARHRPLGQTSGT